MGQIRMRALSALSWAQYSYWRSGDLLIVVDELGGNSSVVQSLLNVRFGSEADVRLVSRYVCFCARSRLAANPKSCSSISNFPGAERGHNPRPETERSRNPRPEVERRRNCRPEADNGQLRAGKRMRTEAHSSHTLEGSTHRAPDSHIAGNIAGNNVVGSPRSRPWQPECLYCLFLTLTGGLR